jgi:hypothetical protein
MPLEKFVDCVNETLNFGFNDGPQVNRKRIENWVNEAQFQIAREVEAPEFQENEILKTKIEVFKYPLPASFLRMQDIFFPEMYGRLRPADLHQFDNMNPKLVVGLPALYTLYKTEVWFFPNPNSEWELELRYIKNPPALEKEGDIPVLNKNYLHLLVDYAVVRAFEAEDDHEAAQYFQGRYQRDLDAYATDVQTRSVDTPRNIEGSWGNRGGGLRGPW